LDTSYPMKPFAGSEAGTKSTDHLPIATQFRQSTFYTGTPTGETGERGDESARLIEHAQGISNSPPRRGPTPYHDPRRAEYYEGEPPEPAAAQLSPAFQPYREEEHSDPGYSASASQGGSGPYSNAPASANWRQQQQQQQPPPPQNPRNSTQLKIGNALWGDRLPQNGGR
jgi:hypothetical protein